MTTKESPTPAQVKAARIKAGLTPDAAAFIIYCGKRAWENWEKPESSPEHRKMHPGLWELFKRKVGELK